VLAATVRTDASRLRDEQCWMATAGPERLRLADGPWSAPVRRRMRRAVETTRRGRQPGSERGGRFLRRAGRAVSGALGREQGSTHDEGSRDRCDGPRVSEREWRADAVGPTAAGVVVRLVLLLRTAGTARIRDHAGAPRGRMQEETTA